MILFRMSYIKTEFCVRRKLSKIAFWILICIDCQQETEIYFKSQYRLFCLPVPVGHFSTSWEAWPLVAEREMVASRLGCHWDYIKTRYLQFLQQSINFDWIDTHTLKLYHNKRHDVKNEVKT